jgi:DNA-binding response OmpR family regulator
MEVSEEPARLGRPLKILIVDHNAASRRYTCEAFAESDIDFEAVGDAAGARSALRAANGCPFDAILLERELRDANGKELLSSLRADGISTPVIFVSVRESLDDRVRGLNSGADDFIVKPFEHSELVARVRAVLRRSARPPNRAVGS